MSPKAFNSSKPSPNMILLPSLIIIFLLLTLFAFGCATPFSLTDINEVQKVELELAVKPEVQLPEPEQVKLDPIQNFDMGLFDQLGSFDSNAEDIFDLDRLAEMVNTGSGRKEISFDEAIELGVLPNLDGEGK